MIVTGDTTCTGVLSLVIPKQNLYSQEKSAEELCFGKRADCFRRVSSNYGVLHLICYYILVLIYFICVFADFDAVFSPVFYHYMKSTGFTTGIYIFFSRGKK